MIRGEMMLLAATVLALFFFFLIALALRHMDRREAARAAAGVMPEPAQTRMREPAEREPLERSRA
ncbi:MAG: hypothetical protein ACYC55_00245 [Candidatus Geothermincolia bacterium]